MESVHHLVVEASGLSGIGQRTVECSLGVAELEHPVAGEHGEEVPGEEGHKAEEEEKVTNQTTLVLRSNLSCHGRKEMFSGKKQPAESNWQTKLLTPELVNGISDQLFYPLFYL